MRKLQNKHNITTSVLQKKIDSEGKLIATVQTLEIERSQLKNSKDSALTELRKLDKKYKNSAKNIVHTKIIYRDSIISTTVFVDRSKDSCSPVYRDTIVKPFAKYIIKASKDTITIKDSLVIPISVVQYDKKENFLGRKTSYTDVILTNPSTNLEEVQSYSKKEKDTKPVIVTVGVIAFILGLLVH